MHSFFGAQDGDFELVIHAIVAKVSFPEDGDSDDEGDDLQKPVVEVASHDETPRARSWWRMLFCGLL